jgi:hypothetical protein
MVARYHVQKMIGGTATCQTGNDDVDGDNCRLDYVVGRWLVVVSPYKLVLDFLGTVKAGQSFGYFHGLRNLCRDFGYCQGSTNLYRDFGYCQGLTNLYRAFGHCQGLTSLYRNLRCCQGSEEDRTCSIQSNMSCSVPHVLRKRERCIWGVCGTVGPTSAAALEAAQVGRLWYRGSHVSCNLASAMYGAPFVERDPRLPVP